MPADTTTISDRPQIDALADDDEFVIVDKSDTAEAGSGTTVRALWSQLKSAVLAAISIGTDELEDAAVTGPKIANESVTPQKEARLQYIAESGTTRTVTADDLEAVLACSNAAGCAVTLPDDASENLDTGFLVGVYATPSSGGVTVAGEDDAELEGSGTVAAGSIGTFFKRGADDWVRLA